MADRYLVDKKLQLEIDKLQLEVSILEETLRKIKIEKEIKD